MMKEVKRMYRIIKGCYTVGTFLSKKTALDVASLLLEDEGDDDKHDNKIEVRIEKIFLNL